MAKSRHPQNIEIDPFFDAPSGLLGVKYAEQTNADVEYIGFVSEEDYSDYTEGFEDAYLENNFDDDSDMEGGLPVPETAAIISQVVRQGSGGSTTVDVVVGTPNLPGVDNFQVRISKL